MRLRSRNHLFDFYQGLFYSYKRLVKVLETFLVFVAFPLFVNQVRRKEFFRRVPVCTTLCRPVASSVGVPGPFPSFGTLVRPHLLHPLRQPLLSSGHYGVVL